MNLKIGGVKIKTDSNRISAFSFFDIYKKKWHNIYYHILPNSVPGGVTEYKRTMTAGESG
jgi:hypothetical protein